VNGRIFQPALIEIRRVLERLQAVEHQQAVLLDDQPGERPPLLGGIGEPRTGMAEVAQGLLEENLRRRVAPLVAPLAVEGMDEHRPAPRQPASRVWVSHLATTRVLPAPPSACSTNTCVPSHQARSSAASSASRPAKPSP